MKIGTTFSYRECQFLKIDPWSTLKAIARLGLNPIRIGTYWQDLQPKKKQYDFCLLDKQIKILSGLKTDIILELGMKAPRWPEYYLPSWLSKEDINSQKVQDNLLFFIEKVIKKYKDNPQIKWINVENEPLNYSGPDEKRISFKTLKQEVDLVRCLTSKPIILNTWLEMHPRKRFFRKLIKRERALHYCLKYGDILGISVYPQFPGQSALEEKHWWFLKRIRKKAKKRKKNVWVTEMQAEPWEQSDDLKNFRDSMGNSSCVPNDIISYFNKLKQMDFETILLWGAEFWYRCRREKNHHWWQAIKKLIKENG